MIKKGAEYAGYIVGGTALGLGLAKIVSGSDQLIEAGNINIQNVQPGILAIKKDLKYPSFRSREQTEYSYPRAVGRINQISLEIGIIDPCSVPERLRADFRLANDCQRVRDYQDLTVLEQKYQQRLELTGLGAKEKQSFNDLYQAAQTIAFGLASGLSGALNIVSSRVLRRLG